jgi:6,7-dimethyl-8-ribityllumazine synthase
MRTKRFVDGLNNNQKIRVICDGVGFYTTVKGAFDMPLTHQRIAVTSALVSLGCRQTVIAGRPTGFATRQRVYDHNSKQVEVEVQIDLCD